MRAKTSWTLYSDVLSITLTPDDKTEAFKLGLDFVTARKAGFHVRGDAHGAITFCLIKEKGDYRYPPSNPTDKETWIDPRSGEDLYWDEDTKRWELVTRAEGGDGKAG